MALDYSAFRNLVLFGSAADISAALVAQPELVHARGDFQFTAFLELMTEERVEIARLLLDAGVDLHAVSDSGHTALHLAQDPAITTLLAARGANLEARAPGGETPLITQSQQALDTGCLKTMAALIAAGADVNAVDDRGHTALYYATLRKELKKINLLEKAAATSS